MQKTIEGAVGIVDEIIDIITRIPKDGKSYRICMNYVQLAQLSARTDANGNRGYLVRYEDGFSTVFGIPIDIDNLDLPIRARRYRDDLTIWGTKDNDS